MKLPLKKIANLIAVLLVLFSIQNCKKTGVPDPVSPSLPTPITDIIPGETVGFGAEFLPADEYAKVPTIQDPQVGARMTKDANLPVSYDLSAKMPPVDNQGKQGSCVAWAVAYAARSYWHSSAKNLSFVGSDGKRNDDFVFSPAFIYNQINKGVDEGSRINVALQLMTTAGVCSWKDMPYNPADFKTQPSNEQKQKASNFKIKKWGKINNSEITFKRFLYFDYPVIIAANLDENFKKLKEKDANGEYIWKTTSVGSSGHAMVIVGYDDERKAFKVQNSWGDKWANKGFIWLSYSLVPKVIKESYILVSGEINSGRAKPILKTAENGKVTEQGVEMNGIIESLGDSPIIKYGFCISLTNPNPTDQIEIKDNPIKALPHSFSINSTIVPTSSGKVFYRIFAETTDSVYYGNTITKTISVDEQSALANGVILLGRQAFDAKTGKELWESYDIYQSGGITDEVGGAIYKNTFFQPIISSNFYVQAINMANGAVKWKYKTESIAHGFPVFDSDVLFTTTFNSVLALNINTGAKKWEYKHDKNIIYNPGCTFKNGFIYYSYKEKINAREEIYKTEVLDANTGKPVKSFEGNIEINPSILDDVIFLSQGNSGRCFGITAYNIKTGNKVWENCDLQLTFRYPIKIVNNTLYHNFSSSSTNGKHSINSISAATGKLNWKIEFDNQIRMSPVYFDEKYFAYTIEDNSVGLRKTILKVHTISDGSIVWEKQIKDSSKLSNPLVAGETIYVETTDARGGDFLTAYDGKTGKVLWVSESNGTDRYTFPKMILSDGTVYHGAASPFR